MTDGSTDFEDMNDQAFPNGGDDFYAQVVQGSLVELEDKKPVDGIADEVELKNWFRQADIYWPGISFVSV